MNSPFDNFIQEMLGNRNPQGNMLTGVSTAPNFYNQAQNNDYYNNPFRRQDSIDAAMAKKLADEQELARQLGIPANTGMLAGDSGGYDSPTASDAIDMGGDAGLGGPGGNVDGTAPNMGGVIGAVLGGLFGLNPVLGYQLGKSLTPNAPVAPTTNTPVTPVAPVPLTRSLQAPPSAQAQAQANAQANAAAVAAAQSSGSAPTGLGGDLGTGASDAAGFGGFGGVW